MTARLAVFASGTGSNFVAIARAIEAGEVDADLVLLFCDQASAPVLDRAREFGVEALAFAPTDCESRRDYEQRILDALTERSVDLVALAGYMRIVKSPLLEAYGGRIVNLHPSLLPDFPGGHSIADAFEAGVPETGVTVHYIDEGIDTGPVIAQQRVALVPGEGLDDLEQRVHQVEHVLYPRVLQQLIGG